MANNRLYEGWEYDLLEREVAKLTVRIAALEKVVVAAKAFRYEIYSDEIELDFVLQFDSALRELEG